MLEWFKNNVDWIIGIITILSFIFTLLSLIKALFKKIFKKFYWEPREPLKNKGEVKPIFQYPKDFKLEGNDILSEFVEGKENFIQQLQFFIQTERYKYKTLSDDYGIEEINTIFKTSNVNEFYRQSENMAKHILDYFNEWIEIIYKIYRKKGELTIELKVKGEANTIKCIIKDYKAKNKG